LVISFFGNIMAIPNAILERKKTRVSSAQVTKDTRFNNLIEVMSQAQTEGAYPCASIVVAYGDKIIFSHSTGTHSKINQSVSTNQSEIFNQKISSNEEKLTIPASENTVFDVGQLTGPLITSALMVRLIEWGQVSLSDYVLRFFQNFGVSGKEAITIGSIISHTSGLPSWKNYFETIVNENKTSRAGIVASSGAKEYILAEIIRSRVIQKNIRELSDIGYLLLGQLVELLCGLSFEHSAHRYILQPLGLRQSGFINTSKLQRQGLVVVNDVVAPTNYCSWRKQLLCGEVHDENAWTMGGVAGHAGLFSNSLDICSLVTEWIRGYHGESSIFNQEVVRTFLDGTEEAVKLNITNIKAEDLPRTQTNISSIIYGWDTPNTENTMQEIGMSKGTFGINSVTGCSVWAHPNEGWSISLLTNAIHLNMNLKKLRYFRSEIYRAALLAF
jgi:serine-type D-Ala-D-Ala carboxypeptidase